MTLALVWTIEAVTDLLDILDYIAERNVEAADHVNGMIQHTANRLPDHPYIHRPGRVAGTREAVAHPNYIVVYRVAVEEIEIVAILHARQQYP